MSKMGSTDDGDREFTRQLGDNLKRLRQARGITQADLAEAVGYSRTSITNIEKGLQQPDLFRLVDLGHALRVPLDDLVPKVSLPSAPPPLVRVKLATRHPENYVLMNTADGTRWVIKDGAWRAAD